MIVKKERKASVGSRIMAFFLLAPAAVFASWVLYIVVLALYKFTVWLTAL